MEDDAGCSARLQACEREDMSKPNSWKAVTLLFWVVFCATAVIASSAGTFKTLLSFNGADGEDPFFGPLVQGTDGNFYGTTSGGGANGAGTVFKITPSGTLTTLYSFCAQANCADGEEPRQGLVQGANGDFYGTTYEGGANEFCDVKDKSIGCGTVFKITPAGKLTTLYSFCVQANCTDGEKPTTTLVQASNGNFYGTTTYGGKNGDGTVFKMTAGGVLTTLYSFCSQANCADGGTPWSGLLQGADGNFYGTTTSGGGTSNACDSDGLGAGCGTAFKITPSGVLTTVYTFCSQTNCTDGGFPVAGLIQATNGLFYGTTGLGGANNACTQGCGTVFKLTSSGTLTTLHSFDQTDGYAPAAALVLATDGNFYGTTSGCGADGDCVYGLGTIFKITPAGTLTTLHSFAGTDGSNPIAGLLQSTNGSFYGTTVEGGANDDGAIFGLSEGLAPFVETRPASGAVGAVITILGNNLKGATSVTFNGTSATFTVESNTAIEATVPTGATSGKVQVVTPSGTLSSNVPFLVK